MSLHKSSPSERESRNCHCPPVAVKIWAGFWHQNKDRKNVTLAKLHSLKALRHDCLRSENARHRIQIKNFTVASFDLCQKASTTHQRCQFEAAGWKELRPRNPNCPPREPGKRGGRGRASPPRLVRDWAKTNETRDYKCRSSIPSTRPVSEPILLQSRKVVHPIGQLLLHICFVLATRNRLFSGSTWQGRNPAQILTTTGGQ